MKISYKKLWKLLIDRDWNKTHLRDEAQISASTLAKLGKNEYVSLEVLVRICRVLHCQIGDIMEIEYDDKNKIKETVEQ